MIRTSFGVLDFMDWLAYQWAKRYEQEPQADVLWGRQLLLLRGLDDQTEVLAGEPVNIGFNALSMVDMEKAANRIWQAVNDGSTIMIHGDYDVDGLTSTAIVWRFLRRLGASVEYYIPNRLDEGYGLKQSGIEYAKTCGASLVITVDCGIRSLEEVQCLNALGIDVVITDHHEPGERLPEALAVVDPHRADDFYPYTMLSGSGVAFKLCQALAALAARPLELGQDLLALAALGAIADVMPLDGENRQLVKTGLKAIEEGALPQLLHLLRDTDRAVPNPITAQRLAFEVCPKLNAAGRMGNPFPAVRFFISEEPEELLALAEFLDSVNEKRKATERLVLEEAEKLLYDSPALLEEAILVLRGEKWHPGVLGIVASRLKEKYRKPVLLLAPEACDFDEDNRLWKGSGRSFGTIDLLAAVSAADSCLESYGGHKMALGLSLRDSEWARFCDAVGREVQVELSQSGLAAENDTLYYDLEPNADAFNIAQARSLECLEPIGQQNETPLFCFRSVLVKRLQTMGKNGEHVKIFLGFGDQEWEALAFFRAGWIKVLQPGAVIDVLAAIELNYWQGVRVQLKLRDWRFSDETVVWPQAERLPDEKLYVSDFALVWGQLEQLLDHDYTQLSLIRLAGLIARRKTAPAPSALKSIMQIFMEAGLVEVKAALDKNTLLCRLTDTGGAKRVKLSDTKMWKQLEMNGGLSHDKR